MNSECQLFEIVGAVNSTTRLTSLLDRRQQEADEHPDDGDHHQKFNQRKTV